MTKKQLAAIVAAVVALAGALGLGVNGQATAGALSERARALEVKVETLDKRLDRIEEKIDRILERGR